MNKGDGLQGALIVRPAGTPVGAPPPTGETVLFLQDWWVGALLGHAILLGARQPGLRP